MEGFKEFLKDLGESQQ